MDISKEMIGLFVMIFVLIIAFLIFSADSKKQNKKVEDKKKDELKKSESADKVDDKKAETVIAKDNIKSEIVSSNYSNYLYERYNDDNKEMQKINNQSKNNEFNGYKERCYGKTLNYDPVQIAEILSQMENPETSVRTKSLSEEFNGLSKEMKVYIIGKMLNKF